MKKINKNVIIVGNRLIENERLCEIAAKVPWEADFNFAKHTTYGLGGRAEIAYFPQNETDAAEIYKALSEQGKNFIILGNGSNVLVSDEGYKGAVICTRRLKDFLTDGENLYCGSGLTVGELLNICKNNSLGGLEFLAGIPATVGGLAYMNASACGKSISELVESVKIFDGQIRILTNKMCNFGVKHSTMRDIKCIILGVSFKLSAKSRAEIVGKIDENLLKRKTQPKGKSCGCVFKNVDGISAGKIIDETGLKGLKIGGASVSRLHANFILNEGGTSADVYTLIKEVKKRVYDCKKIELSEEVVYIGDFNDIDV